MFCVGPKGQYAACQNEIHLDDFDLLVMEMENDSQKGFGLWIFEDLARFHSLEDIRTIVAQLGTRSLSQGRECSPTT